MSIETKYHPGPTILDIINSLGKRGIGYHCYYIAEDGETIYAENEQEAMQLRRVSNLNPQYWKELGGQLENTEGKGLSAVECNNEQDAKELFNLL